jgi:tryptophanyl-tRNA synthetase
MGADILMFNAHKVPVGRDQVQHIEMARDMAQRFNHLYGDHFTLPDAEIDEAVATLPGLDGRKMSKSYNNTIPLFTPRAQLQKQIASIVTDSRAPGEPKETEGSALFQIYQAFASADETEALRKSYAEGIAWGDAKQVLFERIDREVAPLRERYEALMADPAQIERTLLVGADKARALSRPFMTRLRHAVGLRNLADTGDSAKARKGGKGAGKTGFKQYRERDGMFYFKLLDASGETLLQSRAFASPQEAGRTIAALQEQRGAALTTYADRLEPIATDEGLRAASEALEALSEATATTKGG